MRELGGRDHPSRYIFHEWTCRMGLEASILRCIEGLEAAVRSVDHESFSSKVQPTSCDVTRQVWTSQWGVGKIRLRRLWIEHEVSTAESCAKAYHLILIERLTIGDR